MKLVHDAEICESHGVCVLNDPDRFELDDEDNLIVSSYDVSEAELPAVRRAVQGCPRQALRLID